MRNHCPHPCDDCGKGANAHCFAPHPIERECRRYHHPFVLGGKRIDRCAFVVDSTTLTSVHAVLVRCHIPECDHDSVSDHAFVRYQGRKVA